MIGNFAFLVFCFALSPKHDMRFAKYVFLLQNVLPLMKTLVMRAKATAVLLVLIILPMISSAEKTRVPFNTLQNELITCLETDRYGRAWIGTTKGIFQYDGTNLYKYKRQTDKAASVMTLVSSILTASSGELVACSGNGILIYDEAEDNFNEMRYSANSLRLIDIHENGNYMFHDYKNQKVFITNPHMKGSEGHPNAEISIKLSSFSRLSDGNYFFYYRDEFCIMSPELEQTCSGRSSGYIKSISEADGRIFLCTTSGIEVYTYSGEKIISTDLVSEFCIGKKVLFLLCSDGHAYVGIDEEGVYDLDLDTKDIRFLTRIYRENRAGKIIDALGVDDSGQLWLKDNLGNLGCHIISTRTDFMDIVEYIDTDNYPEIKSIKNVATDTEGGLYILTNNALYKFDEDLRQLIPVIDLPAGIYKDIAFDNYGHLFIIDNSGISVFGMNGGPPDFIRHIGMTGYLISQNETLYDRIVFSAAREIIIIDKDLNVSRFDVSSDMGTAFIYARPDHKSLGISCRRDFSALLINDEITYERHEERDYMVTSSIIDHDGMVWQSTDAIGVLRINPATGIADTLDMRVGLPDNMVYRLESDTAGNIWMITTNGVAKYEYSSGKIYDYNEINRKLFDLSYGKLVKSVEGDLYIFSSNYLFKINPTGKVVPPVPRKPVMTSLTVNSQYDFMYPENLTFTHKQNNLTFNFVSVLSQNIWPVEYEYMLENHERSWHKTGIGSATYNNIGPGRYRFLVRAAYMEETASEVCMLDIRIRPAFYQTWWFAVLVMTLLGVLSFYLIRFFMRTKLTVMQYKMKAEQEQMKVEIYSNLSHTIRTPISLIVAPFHELTDGKVWSSYEKRLIGIIDKNISHIITLTKQFLENWSGNEDIVMGNDHKLSLSPKDIVEIIRDSASLFRPSARKKHIEILLRVPESLIVMIDEEKIVKILYNLLHNAIKHTPEYGHVEICLESAADSLVLSVGDSGCGVNDSIKEKIFDRFFKTDSQDAGTAGFGLGLHHTRNLVHVHKGHISVYDNKPSGALFKITLPFSSCDADMNAQYSLSEYADSDEWLTAKESESDLPASKADPVRLLIVEDNEDLLDYLSISMSRSYEVITAHDGMEAIDIFAEKDVDIVITDVMMAKMDGFKLCRWIKENDEYCHLPVIILTAKSDKSAELEGIGAGADAYIKKPFDSSILTAVLENLLENRKKVQNVMVKSLRQEELSDEDMSEMERQVGERDINFMRRFYEILDQHIDEEKFGINELCLEMGFSRTNIFKKLRALTGLTPKQIITDYKFSKAKEMMLSGKYNVSQIANMLGFSSISTFSRRFHNVFGVSPTEYIRNM